MLKGYDCIIIGGGIIGLSCAYHLAKSNKSVLVLERDDIGSGTSGACDHMILLQSKAPGLPLKLAMSSLEIYREWQSELEEDIEFATRGGMILIDKPEHIPVMEDFVKRQRSIGLNVEILDKKQIKKKQPWINDNVIASTYSPDDSQVNPFRVLFALLKKSAKIGAEFIRHSMGPCQGRGCREIILREISQITKLSIDKLNPGRFRPPVKPIPMDLLNESDTTRKG
ncbi:MAG TPA: FAD-dependent oxidoreductase [Pseudothermotoga sp.]